MRLRPHVDLWCGIASFSASLVGSLLLVNEAARPWAVLFLVTAAVLSVIGWGRQRWVPAFGSYSLTQTPTRTRTRYWIGLTSAFVFILGAGLRYLTNPNPIFGLAGFL